MENPDSDEPEKKRPHLNSLPSYPMARHSSALLSALVAAAVLQYQNQKLVQQLDLQKHELQDLEAKIKELTNNQVSYDTRLITLNQLWNQLVDDLVLLGVRARAHQTSLQTLDHVEHFRGTIPSCHAEEMFLCRLLETNSVENIENEGSLKNIKVALDKQILSTRESMKTLEDTINAQRPIIEGIAQTLHGNLCAEDIIIQLSKVDDLMREEAVHLTEVIGVLQLKHKDYVDCMQTCIRSHVVDQSEIKHLADQDQSRPVHAWAELLCIHVLLGRFRVCWADCITLCIFASASFDGYSDHGSRLHYLMLISSTAQICPACCYYCRLFRKLLNSSINSLGSENSIKSELF